MKRIIKNNKISLIIIGIILFTSIILGIFYLFFLYLSFGIVLSLLTHYLMYLQNERFNYIQNSEIEKATFHIGKFSLLWLLLRLLLISVVTFLVIFLSYKYNDDHMIIKIVLYLLGYMFVKILFIVKLYLYKEGDK